MPLLLRSIAVKKLSILALLNTCAVVELMIPTDNNAAIKLFLNMVM
jgi:hypothetical protein